MQLRKDLIDKALARPGLVHRIAKIIGIVPQDLPSKYLIYGQNVFTLNTKDPTFYVTFEPADMDTSAWPAQIAALIQADKAYQLATTGDIKDFALQIFGYKYMGVIPENMWQPQHKRKALPGEPADAEGYPIPDHKYRIRFHCKIVNISNMGQ